MVTDPVESGVGRCRRIRPLAAPEWGDFGTWFGSAVAGRSGELASVARESGWPTAASAPGANPGEEGSPNWWTDSEDPSSRGRKTSWKRGKPGRP